MDETLQALLKALTAIQAQLATGGIATGADPVPSARLDNQVVDSVSASNFKTLGDAPAVSMATLYQQSAKHLARVDAIAEAQLGVISNKLLNVDPSESKSISEMFTGPASLLSALGSAIAQVQQLMKGAQSTPPETAGN